MFKQIILHAKYNFFISFIFFKKLITENLVTDTFELNIKNTNLNIKNGKMFFFLLKYKKN